MKRILSTIVLVCALAAFGLAQGNTATTGRVLASNYGGWRVFTTSAVAGAGSATVTLTPCFVTVGQNGHLVFPFSSTTPMTVTDTSSETITPSAVVAPTSGSPGTCSVTATFGGAHPVGVAISSGDLGLSQAILDFGTGGGIVVADAAWGGTTANITGATTGKAAVSVEDLRSAGPIVYLWNGAAYKASAQPLLTTTGAMLVPFYNEENLTLATGATTTDTAGNLLPASSLILGVSARVTTTITAACTGWTLGDPTTAARFTANNTTLTAGTTGPVAGTGDANTTTGIASATTGIWQGTAAKVRVTCAGGNPASGAIRISVFGFTLAPPQS